jgi:hypothetical protein
MSATRHLAIAGMLAAGLAIGGCGSSGSTPHAVAANPAVLIHKLGLTDNLRIDPGGDAELPGEIPGTRTAIGEYYRPPGSSQNGVPGRAPGEVVDVTTFATRAIMTSQLTNNMMFAHGDPCWVVITGPGLTATVVSGYPDNGGEPWGPLEYGPTPRALARILGGHLHQEGDCGAPLR